MTCNLCRTNSGEYDIKKLCCAVRQIDDVSRATMRRLLARALAHGHDENDLLPGWALEWSGTISNEFAGTSVSVVILAATRAAA